LFLDLATPGGLTPPESAAVENKKAAQGFYIPTPRIVNTTFPLPKQKEQAIMEKAQYIAAVRVRLSPA
jgi:hypothetical protein